MTCLAADHPGRTGIINLLSRALGRGCDSLVDAADERARQRARNLFAGLDVRTLDDLGIVRNEFAAAPGSDYDSQSRAA